MRSRHAKDAGRDSASWGMSGGPLAERVCAVGDQLGLEPRQNRSYGNARDAPSKRACAQGIQLAGFPATTIMSGHQRSKNGVVRASLGPAGPSVGDQVVATPVRRSRWGEIRRRGSGHCYPHGVVRWQRTSEVSAHIGRQLPSCLGKGHVFPAGSRRLRGPWQR